MRFFYTSILALLLVVAASCSASNGTRRGAGGSGAGSTGAAVPLSTLQITPQDAVLDLPSGMPASLAYTVVLVSGGSTTDVTQEATLTVDDPSLGTFSGATFKGSGTTGQTMVHASARGVTTATGLTVKTLTTIVTPGAPMGAPGMFGGPTTAGLAPTLVYPPDGTLVPPNMNVLEFQFQPASLTDLFELTFSTASADIKVYLGCTTVGSGCGYTPDATAWKAVAEAGRGQAPVSYTLRAVSSTSPGSGVGVSATQAISFGQEDITGGLYYWNAGGGATMRYEFGVSGQTAELYLNAPMAGAGVCIGCHALSRDGSRIIEGLDIPGPAAWKVFDVATRTMVSTSVPNPGANFFSFSPDASQLLTSDGNTIVLRDTATGNAITNPLVPQGAMPDWSPDGKRIVYAKGQLTPFGFSQPGVDSASIEQMTLTGTTWGPGPTLVPFSGQNNYYPSFSPDGNWIVFNRAAGNSFDAMDAQVWAVSAAGAAPIHLSAASTGGDSWPKWMPTVQAYKSGQLLWMTFSSRRAYGLHLSQGQTAQLWMTAFDPAKAAAGKDPSYPAFWLPFQDMGSGNHIAQWVLKVERMGCTIDGDCEPTERCTNGVCLPITQ